MKIGIDLGGSHIAIGLVNNNKIIEKRIYYMSENNEKSVENYIVMCIINGIDDILNSTNKRLLDIESIGIATPGNPQNGYIKNLINLGINKFNIKEALKQGLEIQNTNIKIKLQNDGKCAALAEKRFGSLKDYSDCVFLCIGTGIGGAVFFDNKFIKPKRNAGFEFGHMIIQKDGEKCNCGNKGCFEVYCSKKKFKEQMQKILGIENYIGAEELIKKISESKDNKQVNDLLEEYIDNLAVGISNIINIFEPQAISIGGSMSHYEKLIFDKLKNKIYNGQYLFNKENPPIILAATSGNDAGIIGATLIED